MNHKHGVPATTSKHDNPQLPPPYKTPTGKNRKTILSFVVAALILGSFFPLADFFSSANFTGNLQRNLDKKNTTAITAFTAATAGSVAISLLPGDIGTAISEKLADIAGFFMLVIGAIMLEKIMLAFSGFIVFKIIIPLSFAVLLFFIWTGKKELFVFSFKCFIFGIILMTAIPVSLTFSNLVEANFANTVAQSIVETEQNTAKIDSTIQEINNESEKRKWYDIPGKIADAVKNFASEIGKKAKAALEQAQKMFKDLANVLVTMVITVCVIPLLTIIAFGLLIKSMFGIDVADTAKALAGKIGSAGTSLAKKRGAN